MRVTTCQIGELKSRFPSLGVSSYQRAVVWTPRQKATLIRSLLSNYPTGAIILNDVRLGGPGGLRQVLTHLRSSHDIIDGQQRLTTIYEFLDQPMEYFVNWAKNPPRGEDWVESTQIQDVRAAFAALRKSLAPARAGYVPKGTKTKALKGRIADDANRALHQLVEGGTAPDPRFFSLVEALQRLYKSVTRRKLVIEELTDVDTVEAERIYHLINTSGTQLLWWELLWSRPEFVHAQYVSQSPYRTARDNEVRTIGILYRSHSRLGTHVGATNDSFWHAMLALGEYVQLRFAVKDPSVRNELLPKDERKLPVDGLGFRLVSAALSHDIGRAAIYELFDRYSPDAIRTAIDTLFDTADLLLKAPDASSPDYLFFKKYATFGADPVQAYPLVGLFVSASKLVAANKASGGGITLGIADRRGLRALTEEIFREVVTTSKWAGTGDSRLKEWLDRHFDAPTPASASTGSLGAVKSLNPTYKESQWRRQLAELAPIGQRKIDRKTASLHFWVQYLFDSKVQGCLPRGPVQFDHIVSFDGSPRSLTNHPLNIAAVRAELNRSKGVRSYSKWAPTGTLDQEYRLNTLCGLDIRGMPATATSNFLTWADHAGLPRLINSRRKVFEYGLGPLLREWITSGDH